MFRTLVSRWESFWHRPVRAERLALTRILLALALLTDQLVEYLPFLSLMYGPEGFAPHGWLDYAPLNTWRWTILFFDTDNMIAVRAAFFVWVLATIAMLVGYRTRMATILTWLGAMAFLARNSLLKNGGDDVLQIGLFLMMVAPCGRALSWDAWRGNKGSLFVAPWAVRLLQLELCILYLTTGLSKAGGTTWQTGESVLYVLQDVTISRWSYVQLPIPFWFAAILTYGTLVFEIGFSLFAWWGKTRWMWLIGGVAFHLGILATMEVGWFSFYTLALYGVWLPDDWWRLYFGPGRVRDARDDVGETVVAGPNDYLVFFDTLCPICRKSRRMLERFDWGGRLVFRDIHDRPRMAAEAAGVPYARALREIIVVTPPGRWVKSKVLGGFDAIRRLGWTLPVMWPAVPLLYIPGVPWVARIVYRWVARNRYRLVHCDDGTCDLHLRALSNAKLDEAEITKIVERLRGPSAP